ncbi:MAG TPA: L,D-transpeptidase family protein [Sphingomicrobium sp.]|nr:L,D-transpeptidase family protein [Sphingomicrobium sp.]
MLINDDMADRKEIMGSWKIGRVALAALMLGAMPAAAMAQTVAQPTDSAVARFYGARQSAPLWFRPGATSDAAGQLVTILRRAQYEGFSGGPDLANEVDAAIRAAQSGDKAKVAAAERVLSSAWVRYVQAISTPTEGMIFGYLPARVPNGDRILYEAANAPSLGQHLQSVSNLNPIYAQLRDAAVLQAQTNGGVPDPRLLANMDRVRSMPASGRFVLVDAANQRLWMYENGQPIDSMKVVVGKLETPTPLISSMIHYATLNPYWNVPDSLVRKIVAAGYLKGGEKYLKLHGYQILSDWGPNPTIIPPSTIDWKAVAAGNKIIRVRELPGPTNAMGKMKFSFPNVTNIFLHDTPQKELFAETQRTESNGCIRLEDAKRLGSWLLGRDPVTITSEPEQFVKLPQGVPVYVTYLTATPSDGRIVYADDIYGRDHTSSRVAAAGGSAIAGSQATVTR